MNSVLDGTITGAMIGKVRIMNHIYKKTCLIILKGKL